MDQVAAVAGPEVSVPQEPLVKVTREVMASMLFPEALTSMSPAAAAVVEPLQVVTDLLWT